MEVVIFFLLIQDFGHSGNCFSGFWQFGKSNSGYWFQDFDFQDFDIQVFDIQDFDIQDFDIRVFGIQDIDIRVFDIQDIDFGFLDVYQGDYPYTSCTFGRLLLGIGLGISIQSHKISLGILKVYEIVLRFIFKIVPALKFQKFDFWGILQNEKRVSSNGKELNCLLILIIIFFYC